MTITQLGAVTILTLPEAVGYEISEQLREILSELIKKNVKKILMDMSQVDIITSSALGVLFICHKELSLIGGNLVMACVRSNVMETINNWRLERFIPIFPSQAEALQSLQQE